MTTHSSILAWRIPTDRGAQRNIVCGVAKSQTRLSGLHFQGQTPTYIFLTILQ